jgi:hypothetical protein
MPRLRSTFGSGELGDTRWLAVTSGNFYFARYGQFGVIWKVSLDGGPVTLFANLGPNWGDRIEPPLVQSNEGMLLSGRRRSDDGANRPAALVISGDGAVRELPQPAGYTSRSFLTPTGVIHIVDAPQADDSDEAASGDDSVKKAQPHPDLRMWLAPLGGGDLTEFWPDRPETVLPQHVESDGRNGWFVAATEPFNDGFLHDTVWHVLPNADARRLACNPSPESSQIQTESRTGQAFASGDGSLYLVSLRGKSQFWEMVQISYVQSESER